jgi:hypothetical protein
MRRPGVRPHAKVGFGFVVIPPVIGRPRPDL